MSVFEAIKSLFVLEDGPETMMAGVPRSPRWPATRAAFLKTHPECSVCGCKKCSGASFKS